MATKNLGTVKALFIQSSAPSNTDALWRDTSVSPRVTKHYDTVTAQWVPLVGFDTFSYTWANLETGNITVGDIGDDVIKLEGKLKSGTTRCHVVVIITHDGSNVYVNTQMTPYVAAFEGIVAPLNVGSLSGSDILVPYDVGSLGASIDFEGNKNTY